MRQPKVYVAMPARSEDVPFPVGGAAVLACKRVRHVAFDVLVSPFSVCTARNKACQAMLASDATHLMFIDSDVVVPADAIQRLLRMRAPIASGCVPCHTSDDGLYVAVADCMDGEKVVWRRTWPSGVIESPAVGAACLLIAREVLESLGFPWFVWSPDKDIYAPIVGEDVDFCLRAGAAGFGPVIVDGGLRCKHTKCVDLASFVRDSTECESSSSQVAAGAEPATCPAC